MPTLRSLIALAAVAAVGALPAVIAAEAAAQPAAGPDEASLLKTIRVPQGFEATIFAAPPQVNYPVCLAAAATGEVFVGVDEQGSLGKNPGGGRVVRCVDADGDGRADQFTVFATLDHPRGLVHDGRSLWVLHPPFLSVHHDDDGDGVADRQEMLLTGISTEQVAKRGADHTTNGIRMGIDGWISIAVGDFGFHEARGTDGTHLARRGGGVVRVRPDGREAEIYAWGLRNIVDVGIDPFLNLFTRDNTNDGGGWNLRVSHVIQSGEYGYPSRYLNFAAEIMPPLADYGGGSGCGATFLFDTRWPEGFGDAFYACDWGRSQVYRHRFPARGATFDPHEETFASLPQPTDIDVDGSGRMFISSWKDGKFDYSGPNVGYVARVMPAGLGPEPFPDLAAASDDALVDFLATPRAVLQLHAQRELLRRGRDPRRTAGLEALATNREAGLTGRVAAVFTLAQLDGVAAHPKLLELAGDEGLREFALRALTDRRGQLADLPLEPFLAALSDPQPRVRCQALISLGRLGRPEAAAAILPLTSRPAGSELPAKEPLHAQPDPGRVVPHVAGRTLVTLGATDACLAGLDGPHRAGSLAALQDMHSEATVSGLVARLGRTTDTASRHDLLGALVRLHFREGDYTSADWWGTRPDTSGPYYDRKPWEQTDRIARVLATAAADADADTLAFLKAELARHKVSLPGLPAAAPAAAEESLPLVAAPPADPNDPEQIANLPREQVAARAIAAPGDPARGRLLFASQSCVACHSAADGQTPKGPHLVDIGRRSKRPELLESILEPSAKIAQGFQTVAFLTAQGTVVTGFVVGESADEVQVRQADGRGVRLAKQEIDERVRQEVSVMPTGLVANLTPEQLADLLAYLESLRSDQPAEPR